MQRRLPYCGCYVLVSSVRRYLPLINTDSHTTILSSSSRTTLTQTFTNPNKGHALQEAAYVFPLYDGVSVVAFTCTVGDRTITGLVKEKSKARQDYQEAVDSGQKAALLEQADEAADVFRMRLGNVAPRETVVVKITYLGELKHDAEVDGLRFTIPTHIAPRYGSDNVLAEGFQASELSASGISITVDAEMPDGSAIRSVQSPSHPISVSIGSLSTAADAEPSLQRASATLSLGQAALDSDFVVQVVATNLGNPTAVLETHPDFPNHRALMTTLVPKFNIPADKPEIVFVCDRSGSMGAGQQIPNLKSALHIFLKSLPVGVKFNICSFGTRFSFLWDRSHTYDQSSLDKAVKHVSSFKADYGGTEMHAPLKETFNRRFKDLNLEVFLLTDGEIWNQEGLFTLVNDQVNESKGKVRVFTLAIGMNASSSLTEGVARAGNGFAQAVAGDEKMDKKVVRMLRGALTPHIHDYTLEIKYEKGTTAEDDHDDDGFEMVEKVIESLSIDTASVKTAVEEAPKKSISLFDTNAGDDVAETSDPPISADNKYDHVPPLPPPRYLQSPFQIPNLFPFHRTTVYVLLSDASPEQKPKSVLLKGTSVHGPLELEIPITHLAEKGTTIHQLAARSATKELEEGRGWVCEAKTDKGRLLRDEYESQLPDMVEREAVRLGVKYQVAGRWCSFVAVEAGVVQGEKEQYAQDEGIYRSVYVDDMRTHGFVHDAPLMRLNASSSSIKKKSRKGPSLPSFSMPFGGGLKTAMMSLAKPRASPMAPPPPAPAPAPTNSGSSRRYEAWGQGPPQPSSPTMASMAPPASSPDMARMARRAPPPPQLAGFSDEDDEDDYTAHYDHYAAPSAPLSMVIDKLEHVDVDKIVEADNSAGSNSKAQTYEKLAALQTFSGSWTWSPALEKLLGVTKAEAKKKAPVLSDDALATLLAVLYLKRRCKEEEEAWEMMVEKAVGWLEGKTKRQMGDLEREVALFTDAEA